MKNAWKDPEKVRSRASDEKAAACPRCLWLWIFVGMAGSGLGVYALLQKAAPDADAPSALDSEAPEPLQTRQLPPLTPPYFESAEAGQPFPRTISPSLFDDRVVVKAYYTAQEIPEVLIQQPCYCWCEGRGSLLGCHTTRHADE